jgi:hypothetical protein
MPILLPNSANGAYYLATVDDKSSPFSLSSVVAAATLQGETNTNTVSTDDGNFVGQGGSNASHLVRFRIVGVPTNIDVLFKVHDTGPAASAQYMYIWRHSTLAWVSLDTDASVETTNTLTGNVNTNVSDYPDASNDVWVLVAAGDGAMQTHRMYYGQIDVTATDPPAPGQPGAMNIIVL